MVGRRGASPAGFSRVEEHYLPADDFKLMVHFKIVELALFRQNLLQRLSQLAGCPTAGCRLIVEEAASGLLPGDMGSFKKPIYAPDCQVLGQDHERLAWTVSTLSSEIAAVATRRRYRAAPAERPRFCYQAFCKAAPRANTRAFCIRSRARGLSPLRACNSNSRSPVSNVRSEIRDRPTTLESMRFSIGSMVGVKRRMRSLSQP